MKVFVTGATGVLGRAAVAALVADEHEVLGIARNAAKAALLDAAGATPVSVQLLDVEAMTAALEGCEAVCNLATHIPVGTAGLFRRAWRINDRIRTHGSKVVVAAAREAGVRRLVQESVSLVYGDGGDDWITEESTVSVTRSTDPAAVAEDNASRFDCASTRAVVLRFGLLVGPDPITRWQLSRARAGRTISIGDPNAWAHLLHPEDAGTAVASALTASGGVYNVGAEPVRRTDINQVFADAVGRRQLTSMSRLMVRLGGERLAPLTRSHRVSSAKFHEATGWKPGHDVFDQTWLTDETVR
ncbi:MAG: NAD(P)-dependent oxidoreductase [Propionibacteriales bacterium]|nr:NAD(P)-dependent oxidoreductase [Propionibacteriales bacterium]